MKGRSSHVGHARDPNEFLEVFGNELWAVVGDDPGLRLRVKLLGTLQDDLDARLSHRLPQIPVDDVSAAAVQNAAKVTTQFRQTNARLSPGTA
jgi:hypothetical protein